MADKSVTEQTGSSSQPAGLAGYWVDATQNLGVHYHAPSLDGPFVKHDPGNKHPDVPATLDLITATNNKWPLVRNDNPNAWNPIAVSYSAAQTTLSTSDADPVLDDLDRTGDTTGLEGLEDMDGADADTSSVRDAYSTDDDAAEPKPVAGAPQIKRVIRLQAKLDELSRSFTTQINAMYQNLNGQIQTLQQNYDQVFSEFKAYRTAMEKGVEDLKVTVGQTKDIVDQVNVTLGQLPPTPAITDLESQLHTAVNTIEEHADQLKDHTAQLTEIDKGLLLQKDRIDEVIEDIYQ